MFLSIIIPIYNVEKYLNECVDSILKQNLNDYEIILVDDGSPDNSPAICDEYAKNYDFIKVVHKENGGLSSARNKGIEVSSGEYIIFMDSDDFWNEKVDVSKMLAYVKENPLTEMFLFTSLDFVNNSTFLKRKEHFNLSKIPTDTVENYYSGLLNNGNLEVSANTKILKKDFIVKNQLFFVDKIYSEDCDWMLRLLRKLENVKIINEPLYLCRYGRADSITNSIKKKNVLDLLNIIKRSVEFYSINNSNVKNLELCYCSYLWFSSLGLTQKLQKQERKELKPLFKETSLVLKYSNSKKTKLCNFLYKFLGFNLTSFVLGKYIKLKNKKSINKHEVEL